ncbi:DegT/DnrJ/EryC1/StrS family aminotransferase [Noviherbaspirillum saxi]|uniref:DegT/DnrJ/EryC1/StrS family aminotransferase n=2 Tax=Noviherbaspirillum saxi TaxID=2320863 RepID=A0A3A3FVG6_9BURK|nr:DegT/DnrJ/EryC1/StrS family aminotransferase [Noviherbaspirillum saxi]
MQSGWLGTGPRVAAFEAQFAAFKGLAPEQVAAVNSCSAALHLSLLAAGIEQGDEVITTPLTFCATANAILHVGATPVLVDIDPLTMNIDPAEIEKKITSRTKALLPVHFAGLPCAMDEIIDIATRHRLNVIEDCAHAVEATYRGRAAGTMGDFGCFSFYATKNVTTGEGGMVLARDPEPISRVRRMALHGMTRDAWKRFSADGYKHYQVVELGFKYNMMDLQAAIGIHQLKRVERAWERRKAIWQRYQTALSGLPVICPNEPPVHVRHGYHLYTLLIDEARCGISRDVFMGQMAAQGIGVGVHYLALPEHPYYQQHLGWHPDDTPYATAIGRQTVSLPLSPGLTDDEVERVIKAVVEALAN